MKKLNVEVKQEPSEMLRGRYLKLLGFLSHDIKCKLHMSKVLRFVTAGCRTLSVNSDYLGCVPKTLDSSCRPFQGDPSEQ